MPRYVATPKLGHGGWNIAEVDADGMSRRHLFITYDRSASHKDCEQAARLLALASSLEGGLERAIQMVRAALVRQNA